MILQNPVKLEEELRKICSEDPSNTDLYIKIRDLALTIMMSRGLAAYNEMDVIAHDLAADLYLKINDGSIMIYNWRKYIRLRCMSYRDGYRKHNGIQIFTIDDVVKRRRVIKEWFSASLSLASMRNIREISDIVDDIPRVVFELFDKLITHKRNRDRGNIKLSICLSLLNNELTEIDIKDSKNLNFIYNAIRYNLFRYLCEQLRDTSYIDERSLVDSLAEIGFSEISTMMED